MAILDLKQTHSIQYAAEIIKATQISIGSASAFNRLIYNKPPPKRPEYITHEQFKEKQRQLEYTYKASDSINCLEA